jgi:restriction endonuclease S subunit
LGDGKKGTNWENMNKVMNKTKDIYDLPIGWIWSTLDEVSLKITDGSHNPPDKKTKGIPMLSAQNITNNHISFENIRYISYEDFTYEYERANIENGDVLLTIVGSIGRIAFVPETLKKKFAIQRSIALIKPSSFLGGKYLMYAMQAPFFQKGLKDNAKGTAQKGVYLGVLKFFSIPLPSLNEQYRIVEKIEELFSEIEHAEKNLSDINKRLEVYWESLLLKVYKCNNFSSLESKTELITKGASPKWQGFNYVKDKNQVRFITSENIQENYIDNLKIKYLENSFNTKQARSVLKRGDVLLNIVGASIGRAACFNQNEKANINQAVALIRTLGELNPQFLMYYLNSKTARDYYQTRAVNVARANISLKDVAEIPIPNFVMDTQISIVQELDSQSTLIKDIKENIIRCLKQIEILKQTVMYKAFRGELVPQNPEDEPAYKLLEKIKMERLEFLQNKSKDKKIKNNTIKMEHNKSVLKLLKETQEPIPAKEVWLQSKHRENIDDFYAELKSISDLIKQTKSKTEILLSLKQ